VSLELIVAIAAGGVILANRTSDAATRARVHDRQLLSRSVGAGPIAHFQWSLAEAGRLTGGAPWSAKPADPATRSRLYLLTIASTAFGYGAEIVDPASNMAISSMAVGGQLPPTTSAGVVTLLDALRSGQPAISPVLRVGSHVLVATGARIHTTTGVGFFIGFADARSTQLQVSNQVLDAELDRTGVAYVSDPNGVVVAASRPALVGERADQTKFASALSTGRPGFARYRVHGTALTAAYGPVDGFLGWHAVVQQSAGELLGPVRGPGRRFTLTLIAGLAMVAAIAAALNHRRLAGMRRSYVYRGQVLANTSHQLKAPVTAIRGAARTLQDLRHSMSSEEIDEFLRIVVRRCDGLERLVGRILLAAGIEAGHPPRLRSEPIDASATVRRIATDFSAASTRHTISVAVADDLWARADPEALDQVLGLLTENAIKYSPGGGDIRLEAEAHHGEVVIRVVDSGIGVGEDDRSRIFEPFYKGAHSSDGRPTGVGLGLPIAKHLVEEMGGSIGVTSSGAGSVFWFTLPLSPKLERLDLTDGGPVSQPSKSHL